MRFSLQLIAIALQDKLHVSCSVQHVLCATCLTTFLGLQRLHKVELGSTFCNDYIDCFETFASCSLILERITCPLQLAMDFLFPTLLDNLQEKLRRVTLAYRSNVHDYIE